MREKLSEFIANNLDAEFIMDNFDLINSGSSRDVYAISKSIVAKVAKEDSNGQRQNLKEYQVFEQCFSYQDMSDDDIKNDLSHIRFGNLYEDDAVRIAKGIVNSLAIVYAISPNNDILLMERLEGIVRGNIDLEEPSLIFLKQRFSLFEGDLQAGENWMYNVDGDTKIVDYGCDDDIAENHTEWGNLDKYDLDDE
ncbi:hypothetical protein V7124_19680 [Neobacillus niacini]|uniref:hypothetical protein n=1 Tax=Neobacillus niacini TaxID=86668 RepID=UPI00300051DF